MPGEILPAFLMLLARDYGISRETVYQYLRLAKLE